MALTDLAHGANVDLGHALVNNLAVVDPCGMDVARFFVYALLGADHDKSPLQHATRLVVPASQRTPATRWSSHRDLAAKALKRLAGPHVRASLTRVEKSVRRAHSAYDDDAHGDEEQLSALLVSAEEAFVRRAGKHRRRRGRKRQQPSDIWCGGVRESHAPCASSP